MDAFEAELAAILQEQRRDTDPAATVIAPRPAQPPPPRRRPRPRRAGPPWGVLAVVAALAAAAVAAAVVAWQRHDGGSPTRPHVVAPAAIQLSGVTAYDPDGDGSEHNADAPKATDGSPSTFWTTSRYFDAPSLGKPGVGLVLDAGRSVKVAQLGISSDTPGFQAQIKVGDGTGGPWRAVSASKTVGTRTVFDLTNAQGRYLLIWITRLGPGYDHAHVNEAGAV
jgi:hypothetical protein